MLLPLSIVKCIVLHCSFKNVQWTYTCSNYPLPVTDDMRDLSVTRTKAQEFSTNAALVASKAYRSSGALLRSFRSRDNKVLWAVFTAYVPMSYWCWITLQCHRSFISNETSIHWKKFSDVIQVNVGPAVTAIRRTFVMSICAIYWTFTWLGWFIICLQNHSWLGRFVYGRSKNFFSKRCEP